MVLCAVLSTAVLGGIVWIVGDPARTIELVTWIARVWLVTGIWFVGWPLWVTVGSVTDSAPPSTNAPKPAQGGKVHLWKVAALTVPHLPQMHSKSPGKVHLWKVRVRRIAATRVVTDIGRASWLAG